MFIACMSCVGCPQTYSMCDYLFYWGCCPLTSSYPLNFFKIASQVAFCLCSNKSWSILSLILVCRKRPFATCSKIYRESGCSYPKLCKNPSYDEIGFMEAANVTHLGCLIVQIGPKGLEFARYSLDYHTIRNYLHVNRAWGKQRWVLFPPSWLLFFFFFFFFLGEVDHTH